MLEIIAWVVLIILVLTVSFLFVFSVFAYASQIAYRDTDYPELDDDHV